jgi:hypothetical protein
MDNKNKCLNNLEREEHRPADARNFGCGGLVGALLKNNEKEI